MGKRYIEIKEGKKLAKKKRLSTSECKTDSEQWQMFSYAIVRANEKYQIF